MPETCICWESTADLVEVKTRVMVTSFTPPQSNSASLSEHDHCQWDYADEDCYVSMKWSQKEIRRIVGDTEDDVCKFLTIDLDSGCLDVEDGDECEASDACMYVESVGTYRILPSFER